MKTFHGKIVAANSTERTITVQVDGVGGASGAVMGQAVVIKPLINPPNPFRELYRQGERKGSTGNEPL